MRIHLGSSLTWYSNDQILLPPADVPTTGQSSGLSCNARVTCMMGQTLVCKSYVQQAHLKGESDYHSSTNQSKWHVFVFLLF
ncbi:hypothetical protein NPIL_558021 [Nephila pilipes]|uniref:Uncharacterized protein n=1 Tax=Nephila pilipes TaxID=299642 RepID=A0A8X6QHY0_NEPPI|nr:hypothetical protein NPIL_558021 [Nephila pilipes]